MLLLALAILSADTPSVESVTIRERECLTMVTSDGEVETSRAPGLYVIERTAADGPFSLGIPNVAAIMCPRSTIVPAPNDWKVLEAGYPLSIVELSEPGGEPRIGTLEISSGQFRFRILQGTLTEDEQSQLANGLNAFQNAIRRPASPPSNEARAGNLHVLQLWSNDQERFVEEWSQPTPPHLTTESTAYRNAPIYQFIIFGGCTSDEDGNCSLSGEIVITDPNGQPYGETMNFELWDNLPEPTPERLHLAPGGAVIIIEDGEPLGTYNVRLTVTDNHADQSAVTNHPIMVEEAEE